MRVEESIEINRPLQEVFNYVSDVANVPEWTTHTLEVRKDTPGPPQQSDRFTLAIKSARTPSDLSLTVTSPIRWRFPLWPTLLPTSSVPPLEPS